MLSIIKTHSQFPWRWDGSRATLSKYSGTFVSGQFWTSLNRNSQALSCCQVRDLSGPDSHYLITVSSAFSFSFKMLCSLQELKWTFAPGWQGNQVFSGHFPALRFCFLYVLQSTRVCIAPLLLMQYQAHDLTEKRGIHHSLQAEQQFSVFWGCIITLLCYVSRSCALREMGVCHGRGQRREKESPGAISCWRR